MQQKKGRHRLFFLTAYIGVCLIYLLACLIPFLNPGKFWFIAILGLGYPFLLVSVLICLVICALFRSRWFFLALAALLISWQQIFALFGFSLKKEFNIDKDENTLRILSWNVSSWTENYGTTDKEEAVGLRNLMMDAVQMQNADVLCFQEFFESYVPEISPANIPVLQKMGYNYSYFTPAIKLANGGFQGGLCILSKYPIVDTGFYKMEHGNSEGFSIVDIQYQGKVVRVYNTHLESPRLKKEEYTALGEVQESRGIAGKIKRAYSFRSSQAEMLRRSIDTTKYPVILCGDFNDVPNSYAYFTVKGNLQDAFLKSGFGLGRTFQFISPTLRIDYMMADKHFKIEQFSKLDYKYSDHYPQVMDVSFIN